MYVVCPLLNLFSVKLKIGFLGSSVNVFCVSAMVVVSSKIVAMIIFFMLRVVVCVLIYWG